MLKARFWLCAASAMWACGDGQAEDDYRGEPLFTAHGSVVSSEAAVNRELVLSLQFAQPRLPPATSYVQHYVKAEVVGSFPSAFIMRIYAPPPPEVLVATVPGEPAFATGSLVTVRPDHPDWLRQETFLEAGLPDILRTCSNQGECRDRDLNDLGCATPPDYRPCPVDDAWTSYSSATDYSFVYFAEAAAAGSVLSRYFAGGRPIGKGYHLLIDDDRPRDSETTDAFRDCYLRAEQRAFAAINTRRGQDPGAGPAAIDPVSFEVEFPGEIIIALVAESCTRPTATWVEDPNAVSLALTLLKQNNF